MFLGWLVLVLVSELVDCKTLDDICLEEKQRSFVSDYSAVRSKDN